MSWAAESTVTFNRYETATAGLDPPFAIVDIEALSANAKDMTRRAGGKSIRIASKSVRCRAIVGRVLAMPGFSGVLALTLPEALWLAADLDDVVVGYPSVDRGALRQLAGDERAASRVTLMVDSSEHLDLIEDCAPGTPMRVCLDLDASLRLARGRVHLGPRRSPLHAPDDLLALAREVIARPRFRLVGVMAYEGQIAGVGDNAPGSPVGRAQIRAMQSMSWRDLQQRRARAVAAVRELAPLEFVNGGGTGSIERTLSEDAVTEVAAGSGLYAPTLFDTYRSFSPRPAAFFALPVVRRPSPSHATVQGGGWIASGAPAKDRLPTPVWPPGLALTRLEGAGEAQTPLTGPGAGQLRIGDRVWFRHAKAGELCERVNELHLLDGDQVVGVVATYRGEGHAFG